MQLVTSTLYAYEDGTDRNFRNVGTESSDAGRLHTIRHSTHSESLKSRLTYHFSLQSFFSGNFTLINMYLATFQILVQLQADFHENCPFVVSDFNQNWEVCKFH